MNVVFNFKAQDEIMKLDREGGGGIAAQVAVSY